MTLAASLMQPLDGVTMLLLHGEEVNWTQSCTHAISGSSTPADQGQACLNTPDRAG